MNRRKMLAHFVRSALPGFKSLDPLSTPRRGDETPRPETAKKWGRRDVEPISDSFAPLTRLIGFKSAGHHFCVRRDAVAASR